MSKVRTWIREHQLAAAVPAEGAGQQVPALLVMDGAVVKGVPGVLTVLHDGGYDDREALAWLFTEDESLPGRPIDALRENRGAEVKRRAQVLALSGSLVHKFHRSLVKLALTPRCSGGEVTVSLGT